MTVDANGLLHVPIWQKKEKYPTPIPLHLPGRTQKKCFILSFRAKLGISPSFFSYT